VEAAVSSGAIVKLSGRTEYSDASFLAALAILVIASATIAGAWFFQLVLNIQPCPLCLEQRYAYYAEIPLAAILTACIALKVPRTVLIAGFLLLLVLTLFNAGFGVYHSGVEWGWWQGPTECSGPITDLGSGNLFDNLNNVKVIRCDEVQWRLLGLSLAGYNALISALMALIAFQGLRGLKPGRA